MKFTILLAIVALVQAHKINEHKAEEPVWGLSSVNFHRGDGAT